MLRYGILAAELDVDRGDRKPEDIVVVTRELDTGNWGRIHFHFAGQIAQWGLGTVKVIQQTRRWKRYPNGELPRGYAGRTLKIVGYQSDVDQALALIDSLLIQGQNALELWVKSGEGQDALNGLRGSSAYAVRRDFLMTFAYGARARIEANKRQVVEESGPGTEVMLLDRKTQVDLFVERNGKVHTQNIGAARSAEAARAGYRAGQNASTGEAQIATLKALGS